MQIQLDLAEKGLEDPTEGDVDAAILQIPSASQIYLPNKKKLYKYSFMKYHN